MNTEPGADIYFIFRPKENKNYPALNKIPFYVSIGIHIFDKISWRKFNLSPRSTGSKEIIKKRLNV